jgi:hypothetical protein
MSVIFARGWVTLQIDGDAVSIAPCTISEDGGVFVVEEHERDQASTGDTVTYRRIGTISDERIAQIKAQDDE